MNSAVVSMVAPVQPGQVVKLAGLSGGIAQIAQVLDVEYEAGKGRWIVRLSRWRGTWFNADRVSPAVRSERN